MREGIKEKLSRHIIQVCIYQYLILQRKSHTMDLVDFIFPLMLKAKCEVSLMWDTSYLPQEKAWILKIILRNFWKKSEILLYSNSSRRKFLHLRKVIYIPLPVNRSLPSEVLDIHILIPTMILALFNSQTMLIINLYILKPRRREDN